MKRGISVIFLLFCLGISAQQLPSFLPEGGKVTERNRSGKTWFWKISDEKTGFSWGIVK